MFLEMLFRIIVQMHIGQYIKKGVTDMTIEELCNTIYLGDRWCKSIEIEEEKISFEIDLISRLQEGTSQWNYYNDRNIENGFIVFDKVINCFIRNGNTITDDIEVRYINNNNGVHHFIVEGTEWIKDSEKYITVEIEIYCRDFYLYDNGTIIRD